VDQTFDDDKYKKNVVDSPELSRKTGLVYDHRMQKHCNMWDKDHPECPQRIDVIYSKLEESGLTGQCYHISARSASYEELSAIHSELYVEEMKHLARMSPEELLEHEDDFDSIYLSHHVYECASLAVGCTLELLDAALTDKVQNGVAVVRPPGHHALPDSPMGFCYFNNVAIAAHFAKEKYGLKRILIVDWDIHWGNGTERIFESDPSVIYISLHRYDNTHFWPHDRQADYVEVGVGDGEGKTVHVAWNKIGMGDSEYLAAFNMLIMPIAYEFQPELVLVSCGFDSGLGDPKGLCCVTPEGFAQMTHLLMGLADGKVLLVLEGGYNLSTISNSMEACVKVLLGNPCPVVDASDIADSALESITNACRVHSKYWKFLKWAAKLLVKEEEDVAEAETK